MDLCPYCCRMNFWNLNCWIMRYTHSKSYLVLTNYILRFSNYCFGCSFFFSFLSIQREIWPSSSPWVSKSKWLLKVYSSQVSAKPRVFESILTWKTWVSPGLLLESLLAWWTVGCFSLVFRSLRVSHRVSWSVRSMALPASPLDCFLPSLEPAIILEMNKSEN